MPASGSLVIFKYRSLVHDIPDVRGVVRVGTCWHSGSMGRVVIGCPPGGVARVQDHVASLGTGYNSLMQVRKSIVIIFAAPIIPVSRRVSGNDGIGADLITGVIGLALLR